MGSSLTTTPYRIAFLTDIHGNVQGLEGTLREVRATRPIS